jgi:hypothetical protein
VAARKGAPPAVVTLLIARDTVKAAPGVRKVIDLLEVAMKQALNRRMAPSHPPPFSRKEHPHGRVLAQTVWTSYRHTPPMRLPVLALLATLLPAQYASAEGIVVEPRAYASVSGITVSWHLPPGFEESELLLEVEGGPRVRLTDELRGPHPRVVVVLPALAGSARFLVRAGREDEERGGKRREIDIARSESFALAGVPTTGRVPVWAATTRPVPGSAMEWWAEATGRSVEGPSPALKGPIAAASESAPPTTPALPSSPPVPAASPLEVASGLPEGAPAASLATANDARERAFSGATVPLRN